MLVFAFLALAAQQSAQVDRAFEGSWYVSDTTDNNSGERQVYAFQSYFPSSERGYVTVTIRCSDGETKFFLEWTEIAVPDQAVVSVLDTFAPSNKASPSRFIFEKSDDLIERGLHASADDSLRFMQALQSRKTARIVTHLSYGDKAFELKTNGVDSAWSRVQRHCPVKVYPLPPI